MEIIMKLSLMKSALIALGVVAVGTCALPALAQNSNDAYRQGYDQGYRDGMQARQQNGGASRGDIQIEQASYGVDGSRCDARNSIQAAVQGRRSVDVLANNNLCGDPAENRVKNLYVTYRCGNGQVMRGQVREEQILQIRCR
jgi:hypothetical protein